MATMANLNEPVLGAPTAGSILELPDDVLTLVLSHLPPRSFLNFTQASREARGYQYDPFYWRTQTASTFRLPISPLLHADGQRWYFLYKKLKTQTRLYTWGQGLKSNLGPASSRPSNRPLRGPRGVPLRNPRLGRPRTTHPRVASQWPTEAHLPNEVGIIVDLQCGGWSTTVLTSDGRLFTVGILDAADGRNVGSISDEFTQLEHLSQSTTAISQFSSGRRHILALTEDGEILSWDRMAKGYKVFSATGRDFGGRPKRVVAGWETSSVYVPDVGIVYWKPVENNQSDEMLDGVHVQEKTVPGTATQKQKDSNKETEVLMHIMLEGFAVYITNEARIFAYALDQLNEAFEVLGFAREGRELKDLQGSFRSFAVFTASGEVLLGNTDYLRRCAVTNSRELEQDQALRDELFSSRPQAVPALQNSGVIQVAFGDYHYHALHADGRITSYGTDPQSCGALGLGDFNAGSRFRGVVMISHGMPRDSRLLPIANIRGRQIWFEPEKKDWLMWMEEHGPRFAQDRLAAVNTEAGRAMFSEWMEQEGRNWAEGPLTELPKTIPNWSGAAESLKASSDYDNLGAYFPISIAAAGWHSGALVLVDEAKADEAHSKWMVTKSSSRSIPGEFEEAAHEAEERYIWLDQDFPKIRLPNGSDSREDGTVQPWREGMPSMADLGLSQEQTT